MRSVAAARLGLGVIAVALIGVQASPADASDRDIRRFEGDDRFATAAEVSRHGPSGDHVLVATGMDFPDALAAGPLAYRGLASGGSLGPVLLTARDTIPSATAQRLRELDVGTVYVVGGPASVSSQVAVDLVDQAQAEDLVRIDGPSRFHTAAEVSRRFFEPGSDVVLATGADYPDALSGTPLARRVGGPVLLTHQDHLPEPTEDELARLQPERVFVMGGDAAVSEEVADHVRDVTGAEITRISGDTRMETAIATAYLLRDELVPRAFVATSTDFPDALTGGALAGARGSSVLLAGRFHVPDETALILDYLGVEEIVILGGTSAVPEEREQDLARHFDDTPPETDETTSSGSGYCVRGFSRYDHEREYVGASTAEHASFEGWDGCSEVEVNIMSPGDFGPGELGPVMDPDDDGGPDSVCSGNVVAENDGDNGYAATYSYIPERDAREGGVCANHFGYRDHDGNPDATATVLFDRGD